MISTCLLHGVLAIAAAQGLAARAEAQAEAARAMRPGLERQAIEAARRALALTSEFDPTLFTTADRHGSLAEDDFRGARAAYRNHRAVLYAALGALLARDGQMIAAERHLTRAFELTPQGSARLELARVLLRLGRPIDALSCLLSATEMNSAEWDLAAQAADAARLMSVQAEVDRKRLARLMLRSQAKYRPGPISFPLAARLSTGQAPRFDGGQILAVYAADEECRACSADLALLQRMDARDLVIMILPVSENADDTLRRIMRLYQYSWPIVTGMDARRAWGMATPALLLVARDGFVGVEMQAPLDAALGRILAMLRRDGAREQLPRPAWDGRAHEIPEWPRASRLLPEGLFTGAGDPAPDSYGRAVAAFRERRYLEAERLFDALGASGDGWLLAPEARFNRALCMRAAGHAAEARRILRSIGDAREQDAVDRAQDELRAR